MNGSAADGEEVVLLSDTLGPIGSMSKSSVHTTETPLHLAFSSYLFDRQGRLLLTRRALTKRTWGGVWTNSCCGHPSPGESMTDAVSRRIDQELGLTARSLMPVLPDFRYRAVDASGIVENEYCPVYAGAVDDELRCDPDEVMEHTWVPWTSVKAMADDLPALLSPWAVLQIRQLDSDLPSHVHRA